MRRPPYKLSLKGTSYCMIKLRKSLPVQTGASQKSIEIVILGGFEFALHTWCTIQSCQTSN